eukprot:Anaeramoba_ignava/a121509_14.p1 GENE.a121509_14~~a121509_14.p1  ORF type:complete len:130 (-),score=45.22 a121509_14:23-388(-)
MLESRVKDCPDDKRFPLGINATKVIEQKVVLNKQFIINILTKIDWEVLLEAIKQIGYNEKIELPLEIPVEIEKDDDLIMKIHHALLEIEIIEGELICQGTGRKFTIKEGIANMLLNSEELK